jgi:polyferredoxin
MFATIAITLWLALGNIFYLYNFAYIGFFVSLGIALMIANRKNGRLFIQFFIGLYMLVYLGIIHRENMQIEGFFYYLSIGVFQAALIHYVVAKILGPFIFGRGWCGYACWTAMFLDLLPYAAPKHDRVKKLGILRLGIFLASLIYFLIIFIYENERLEDIMYISFIVGNIIYYVVGILLAIVFKDNRAFCKYFCPVTVFMKPSSYFSLLRIKLNAKKCILCCKCLKACPMNVDMMDNKYSRKNGTECILCMNCVMKCPKKALSW